MDDPLKPVALCAEAETPLSGDCSGDSWLECVEEGVVQLPEEAPPVPLPAPLGRRGGMGGGWSTGMPDSDSRSEGKMSKSGR